MTFETVFKKLKNVERILHYCLHDMVFTAFYIIVKCGGLDCILHYCPPITPRVEPVPPPSALDLFLAAQPSTILGLGKKLASAKGAGKKLVFLFGK